MNWTIKNYIVLLRNKIIWFLYVYLLRPIFFLFDPEDTHDFMTKLGILFGRHSITRWMISLLFSFSHPILRQNILGIHFPNPVGLAAGFDKDGLLTDILPHVGFGFVEVGSITGEKCMGNMKPRLWRLKKSGGLVVNYGLKNRGSEETSNRIREKNFKIPIGTNIAKTNNKETIQTRAGVADYIKAFSKFTDIGQYFVINISCPNAFGGEPFTDPAQLKSLLLNIDSIPTTKPIFLKISPDLNEKQVDDIIKVCDNHHIHGFVCSNLTKNRDNEKIKDDVTLTKGGISGKVVNDLSTEQIRLIYRKTKGKYVIIGCGGIFSTLDAYRKIKAGASLVELITGLIFEGPQLVSEINRGLVSLLKQDGFANIKQVRGRG